MGSVTSNPNVSVSLLAAAVVDAYEDRRDVIFGQIGANGSPTAVSDALNTNVEAMTTTEIKTLFGADSYLTNMVLDWKTSNGSVSPLDVVGVDAGAGMDGRGRLDLASGEDARGSRGTRRLRVLGLSLHAGRAISTREESAEAESDDP